MCVNMILKGERESKRERERKVIEYNTKRKHDMVPYYFIGPQKGPPIVNFMTPGAGFLC